MSSATQVLVKLVSQVEKHPNADRLDIVKLYGFSYTLISQKDAFKPGDLAVFFPVDSVIPDEVLEKIGMFGLFEGAKKNRVKTKKLRGIISQGFIAPYNTLFTEDDRLHDGADVTERLGIETWEPEPKARFFDARLHPLPVSVFKYDIEPAQKYDDAVDYLMDKPVIISEKLEGSNFAISYDSYVDKVYVCQRNHSIVLDEGQYHPYHDIAEKLGLFYTIKLLYWNSAYLMPLFRNPNRIQASTITLYGEYVGPGMQGNLYNLKKPDVYFFDLFIDGKAVDGLRFIEIADVYHFKTVPYIFKGTATLREVLGLSGSRDIVEYSNNYSRLLPDVHREGIVIKPVIEEYYGAGLGRLHMKVRSPEYLEKTGR